MRPGSRETERPGRADPLARIAVGTALVLSPVIACARPSPPPGGPPDNIPPAVVSTSPDTFSVVEPFAGPVVFRFSERISEQASQAGSLDEAVTVSPATGEVTVEHDRSALEVSLGGGYREGRVYRIRVLPVIQDMFGNTLAEPFELVFSTGPAFRPGVLAGAVRDRITGEPVRDARIRALPAGEEDSVTYLARTDREGIYTLRYLSPGAYELTGFDDRNRDGEVDAGEPRASARAMLEGDADTVLVSLEVLAPDTTPALVTGIEAVDSSSLRISTDDFLDPADSLDGVRVTLVREDGEAPAVDSLLHEYEWEARARLVQEAADRADSAAADTAAATPDTVAADTAAPSPAAPDTAAGPYGAGEPARAEQTIYALLDGSLEAGVEYAVEVSGVRNIAGVAGGSGEDTVTWEPPPPDTTGEAADTADVEPDTTDAEPDTVGPGADRVRARQSPAAVRREERVIVHGP